MKAADKKMEDFKDMVFGGVPVKGLPPRAAISSRNQGCGFYGRILRGR